MEPWGSGRFPEFVAPPPERGELREGNGTAGCWEVPLFNVRRFICTNGLATMTNVVVGCWKRVRLHLQTKLVTKC
jgi:hypothetical protein